MKEAPRLTPYSLINQAQLDNASVVKLVDTPDSKSGSFTGVAVQVRPLVPTFRYLATPRTPIVRVKPHKNIDILDTSHYLAYYLHNIIYGR